MINPSHRLNFKVGNLGSVLNGRFEFKPLTIFCGPNNSGKTWVLHSLYHFFDYIRLKSQETKNYKIDNTDEINDKISSTLPSFFNINSTQMEDAKFHLEHFDGLQQFIESLMTKNIILMPAERNGLHSFFRELSAQPIALWHPEIIKDNIVDEWSRNTSGSQWAVPISHYIGWLNELAEIRRTGSREFHAHAERVKKELAGGAYRVNFNTGKIGFKPYQPKHDGRNTPELDLHVASSSANSLFGLWFYLEYQARAGSILMIDKPELNIHPEKQRKFARLLVRLVNSGLNITISTHSDFIVREFSTLLMLSLDRDGAIRKRHNYREDEILKPELVGAHLFDERTIKPFRTTPLDGIEAISFDGVIRESNAEFDNIYYSLEESA